MESVCVDFVWSFVRHRVTLAKPEAGASVCVVTVVLDLLGLDVFKPTTVRKPDRGSL